MRRALPKISLRFAPVWWRNLRVWRKLMVPSILGNFGEPVLYLLAFGFGLGRLIGGIGTLPYITFLATGIVCGSVMNTASFEALYSAFTRMTQQQTWAAMLDAPLEVDDIVLGEILWSASKGLMSASAVMAVAAALGLIHAWSALWALPVIFVGGFCFGALAMVMTAVSRSYDFFMYYFTLVMTPMLLLSGVFFPLASLPRPVAAGAWALPLAHLVVLVRPLLTGTVPPHPVLHLAVILAYGLTAFWVATLILRRRLMR